MDDAPLILTLRFDEASFARFDAERRLHFPPARNHIPAHLTLFHHLPGERHGEISEGLASLAVGKRDFPWQYPPCASCARARPMQSTARSCSAFGPKTRAACRRI